MLLVEEFFMMMLTGCLQVSLSFDKNKTKPGESLNLKVTADPASYVGLLAVDQSVLLLKGGNDITQKDVSIVGFSQIVFNTHDIYIVFFKSNLKY